MGTGFWSTGCRSDVEYYGMPGTGSWYRSRFGTYSVTGGVYQTFAAGGYECYVTPFLGAPVKAYGWIAEMNYGRGCWGQWFENGAIGYHDGRWNVMYGRYGQTGGMSVAAIAHKVKRRRPRRDAEQPPDHEVLLRSSRASGMPAYEISDGATQRVQFLEGVLLDQAVPKLLDSERTTPTASMSDNERWISGRLATDAHHQPPTKESA